MRIRDHEMRRSIFYVSPVLAQHLRGIYNEERGIELEPEPEQPIYENAPRNRHERRARAVEERRRKK